MSRQRCKFCTKLLVDATGPKDSPILLAGEFPGYYEVTSGVPFAGPHGDVLKQELANASVDWRRLRMTNLWGHEPNKDKDDFNYHLGRLIQEMDGRMAVLLMGSESIKPFFPEWNVSDVSGLELKSKLIPSSVKLLMAMPNPGVALGGTVGENRLAITKFFNRARRYM